jgi:hypothetical protein
MLKYADGRSAGNAHVLGQDHRMEQYRDAQL